MRLPLTIEHGSTPHRVLRAVVGLALLFVVIWLPATMASFELGRLTDAIILAIAAVGLNLLFGFNGQLSLGHSAFYGIGAYGTAILMVEHGWSPFLTFPVTILLCFLVGVIVGAPALRLRGTYVVIVTLTVGLVFPPIVRRFPDVTGGSFGLSGWYFDPPKWDYFRGREGQTKWTYWVAVVCLALAFLLVANIMKGRMGRAIRALRDNEVAATIMGVNRAFVRTVVFGVSAGLTALAGSLYALKVGLIVPETFSLFVSINLIVAMVLGGSATLVGPILGAFLITYIPHWTAEVGSGHVSSVIFGVTLLVFPFVLPGGLLAGIRSITDRVVQVRPAAHQPCLSTPEGTEVLAGPVLGESPSAADDAEPLEPAARTTD